MIKFSYLRSQQIWIKIEIIYNYFHQCEALPLKTKKLHQAKIMGPVRQPDRPGGAYLLGLGPSFVYHLTAVTESEK